MFFNALEEVTRSIETFSYNGLFFMTVVVLSILLGILREQAVYFVLSVLGVLVVFVQRPLFYFKFRLEEIAQFYSTVKKDIGKDMVLLDPSFRLLKLFSGCFLLIAAGSLASSSIIAFSPSEYWVEQVDYLSAEEARAGATHNTARNKLIVLKSNLPTPGQNDPRLVTALEQYEPIRKEHEQYISKLTSADLLLSREKQKLPSEYKTTKILEYLEKPDNTFKKTDVLEYKKTIKNYCGCLTYHNYVDAIRGQRVSTNALAIFSANHESVLNNKAAIEKTLAEEKAEIEILQSTVTNLKADFERISNSLLEAKKKDGLQFKQGFQVFAGSFISFLMLTWFIGLAEEWMSVFWRLIRTLLGDTQHSTQKLEKDEITDANAG